jgi:molybdenum cofactor cytidylyltransferase
MTAAVILAAGASTRLGEPKQLVVLAGETMLERAVRTAREAGCSPIVVVLGAEAGQIRERCTLHTATVVVNSSWQEGMASSIRTGISAIGSVNGVILMTCDQPAVTPHHLRSLSAHAAVTASSYAGRRGVPAYFPASAFAELAALTGDAGARELLRSTPSIPLPLGDLDVDTSADRANALRQFG